MRETALEEGWRAVVSGAARGARSVGFREPLEAARLRHDQRAVAAGAEGLGHRRALVVRVDPGRVEESDRDLHSVAVRAHRLGVPGGRTEAQAAVAAHLDAHVVDALRAGDTVLVVPELEDAVLVHELLCRDARAEDVGPPLGADLEEDILLLRVDVRHARTREDGAETQPARHAARADAATLRSMVKRWTWPVQQAGSSKSVSPLPSLSMQSPQISTAGAAQLSRGVCVQAPAVQRSCVQASWSSQSAVGRQGGQPGSEPLWQTPAPQNSVVQAFWSSQSAAAVEGVQPARAGLSQTPASQDSVVQAFWS